jgi:hypothetical protein
MGYIRWGFLIIMRKLKVLLVWLMLLWLTAGVPCFGENPWLIRINIPEFKLYLYRDQEIYQIFNIAIGRTDTPSPLGDFLIVNKVFNPTWYPPDGRTPVPAGPSNPLGKYWLGLSIEGYGIHGNSAEWSIGTSASLGCFRLHNKDIQKLFSLVSVGTPVQIVYQTVRGGIDPNNNIAWLEVFPDIYQWSNPELESAKVMQSLGWIYEPHWQALGNLLKAKKPLKVEVPRVIKVEGEPLDIDGFYWQQRVYLSQKCLEVLTVNFKILNDELFPGFVKLDTTDLTGENRQYFWDPQANTLRIIRLKVLFNGMELSETASWSWDHRLLMNIKAIASQLGTKFEWDYISKVAVCNEMQLVGEPRDGVFWVGLEELQRVWPRLKTNWDEKNYTLELIYKKR